MKVKTIRQHGNGHAPQYLKNVGRKYELPDAEAKRLIRDGLVEADKPGEDNS